MDGETTAKHRFEPARSVRTFDAIVEQLHAAIISGAYGEGDRLPSQRELAQQFGVARNGVLQALRVLERQGLITIRPGASGGAFVRSLDGQQLGDHLDLLMRLDQVSVREMVEFRKLLEGQNAYWAAERGSRRDRDAIVRVARRTGAMLPVDSDARWAEMLALDSEFHVAIAQAARNRATLVVMHGVVGSLTRELGRIPRKYADKMHADLDRIATAIADSEPDRARELMRRHIDDFLAVSHPGTRGR